MPPSTVRSREPAKLSNPLHHELSVYALAAGVAGVGLLASSQPVDAQIVYTAAHSELDHDGVIPIDLNHDGLTDILIREIPYANDGFAGNALQAVPQSDNEVKRGYCGNCAAAMAPGSIIGPHDPAFAGPAIMFNVYGIYYFGSWDVPGAGNYLGIRFLINGETHYGWARVYVRFGFYSYVDALLTGYAYETQPNKPIHAGDTGSSEADSAGTETSCVQPYSATTLGALALGAKAIPIWRVTTQ
jgi:hypothetical protein